MFIRYPTLIRTTQEQIAAALTKHEGEEGIGIRTEGRGKETKRGTGHKGREKGEERKSYSRR